MWDVRTFLYVCVDILFNLLVTGALSQYKQTASTLVLAVYTSGSTQSYKLTENVQYQNVKRTGRVTMQKSTETPDTLADHTTLNTLACMRVHGSVAWQPALAAGGRWRMHERASRTAGLTVEKRE